MSAEAPGEVREGFYDLPEVPGVPSLVSDAMLAILSDAAPADVEKLRREWLRHGVMEGDEAAFAELIWDALGADEDTVAEGLRIFHGEEISGLCEQRGWAPAAFLKCSCSLMCFAELARTAPGREVLDSVTARLKEAREAPTGEEPQGKRRRTEGGASDGTWLRPVADVTPALLDSFLQGRQRREEAAAAAAGQSLQQVQLAVAAELIHDRNCCLQATLACINQSRAVVHVYSSCDKNDIRLAECGAGEARCARRGPRRRAASRAPSPRSKAAGRRRHVSRHTTLRPPLTAPSGACTHNVGFRIVARRIFDTQIHKVHTQGLEQGRK